MGIFFIFVSTPNHRFMLRRLGIWLAAVVLLAQHGVLYAQEAGKNIEVRVMAYQDFAHGQKMVFIPNPMPGAVVSLKCRHVKIYAVIQKVHK